MRVKDAVGRFGEQVAADHLNEAGLTILARNWRTREGELDIIALDEDELVFVEVKTRSSPAFGTALEAVDRRKAARVRRLAIAWLDSVRGRETLRWSGIRFDVVGIQRTPNGLQVNHVRGAF